MRPLCRSLRAAALTLLAALVVAAPAQAVKPKGKLRAIGPVKVVKPFKGVKATAARPLASASAVIPRGGFDGAVEPTCCHTPSEVGGAVGETQVVQTDAMNMTVFDRTGSHKKTTPITELCGANATQPRVLYDRFLKRWFIVLLTNDSPTQVLCVYTSKTSSATGAYHALGFFAPQAGGRTRDLRIGMDTDGLFVVVDQYNDQNAYARTGAITLSKAYLVKGEDQGVGLYDGLPRLTPPVVVDARRAGSYFLAAGSNTLELWKATAMHRGGPLAFEASIPTTPFTGAIFATQPGTSDVLLTGNANFKGSSYQTEGRLVNAHTINRNGWPTIRWYSINVDAPSIARSGRLFESSTSDDFAPSVAAAGDSVFFSWTSTDARHADENKHHGPRMRFATYETGDASANKTGVAARTGTIYRPTPGVEVPWNGGQVTLSPQGAKSGCGYGTYAFAVGPFAAFMDRWQGTIKKFSTC